MAKYIATLSFSANVEIEADNADEARIKAEDIQDGLSVFSDEVVEALHDNAYTAGGMGEDPPLKRKKAFQLRNEDFTQDDVTVYRKE